MLISFKQGREEGFNHFFNEYYKALHFFAISYINDQLTAEDIVSDSFIKLWNKRDKFETEAGLKSYLYKIVHNSCLRHIEQNKNRTAHIVSMAKQTEKQEQSCLHTIITAETLALLHNAINHLPAQCKKVFTKLYIEGKSVAEAAKEMNLTISTVKNQKARGIKLLKPKLSP